MINGTIPSDIRYLPDERTVSPREHGDADGWPAPMECGGDMHKEQAQMVAETVAQVKNGIMPAKMLDRYGIPCDFSDWPEPLARRIKATAIAEDVSIPYAWAAEFRMDDWLLMARLMLDNVLRHGGNIRAEYAYKSNEDSPNNPDLVGRIAAEAEIADRIRRRMENVFDAKNEIQFARPWQCVSTLPDSVAATLFTLSGDPIGGAGAGHSEYVPGHASNGAESACAVEAVTEGPEAAYVENEVLGRLGGQGRTAEGLHYWEHCARAFNHVLAVNGTASRLG